MSVSRQQWSVIVQIATVSLAALVYLLSAPSGVMTDDSAEFQTLAVTLGLTHPPGYPLLLCVGKCFAALPIGEIAWRLTLMSVVFGAATLWLLFGLVDRLTRSTFAALVATLCLAFSHTFWSQSVLTEAYTLNAFLLLALLRLMVAAKEADNDRALIRPWLAASLIVGVGFGNHQTIVVFVPIGAIWFLWLAERRGLAIINGAWLAAMAGAIGGSIYLFMLLRYVANGSTAAEMWFMARGGPSQDLMFIFGPKEILGRFVDFIGYFVYQFPGPGLVLAAIGVIAAWRRSRAMASALGALGAIYLAYALNFDSSDVYVFYVPCYLATAVFVGYGVAWTMEWARENTTRRAIVIVVSLSAVVAPPVVYRVAYEVAERRQLVLSIDKGNVYYLWPPKRSAMWMSDGVRALLEAAPPNGVLITDWNYLFAARYYQDIERTRRDVTVLNKVKGDNGPNGWSAATAEWLAANETPVLLTGSDEFLKATQTAHRYGPGFYVSKDGTAPTITTGLWQHIRPLHDAAGREAVFPKPLTPKP